MGNGYVYLLFLLLLHCVELRQLSFLAGGGFLLTDSFHRFSSEKPDGLHEILVCGGCPHGKIGWRSLRFALCLFIYLFIFVYLLLVCMFTF